MEERERKGKQRENSRPISVFQQRQKKIKTSSTRFHLSLYSAQISKNTTIPTIPIIHEGKNGKNHKKEVKWEVNGEKKNKKMQKHFRTVRKFCTVRKFAQYKIFAGVKFSHPATKLLSSPTFSALISFWFFICNAEFNSNSTFLDRLDNLGIINLQKLKFSHKMQSVE